MGARARALLFVNRDEGAAVRRKSNANLIISARVRSARTLLPPLLSSHFTSIRIIALTLYLTPHCGLSSTDLTPPTLVLPRVEAAFMAHEGDVTKARTGALIKVDHTAGKS